MRWVQLPAAGVEPWLERVRETPDVQFTSATGAYATQVAELALGLLIAGVRGFAHYARTRRRGIRGPSGCSRAATVAIVGAGGIGRVLIDMLAPHDVEVIAVTRSGRDGTLPVDRMSEIWGSADHFVIAAPATDATEAHRRRARAGGDEAARLDRQHRPRLADRHRRAREGAGREERIGGAALDVTDPEPLPDGHPLWDSPRALITPHVANPPSTMDRDLARRVEENVRRFTAGEELVARVSPQNGY